MVPKRMTTVCSMVFLAVALFGGTAVSQTVQECSQSITTMTSCLSYVTGPDNRPSSACCMALANVVRTQPRCLCLILDNGGSDFGLKINQTRALDMPKLCNVQTPPVSECNRANAPGMAPQASPPTPETGSKTVPSSGNTGTINFGVLAAILLVFIASADFIKIF